jgi:hypothetical protein
MSGVRVSSGPPALRHQNLPSAGPQRLIAVRFHTYFCGHPQRESAFIHPASHLPLCRPGSSTFTIRTTARTPAKKRQSRPPASGGPLGNKGKECRSFGGPQRLPFATGPEPTSSCSAPAAEAKCPDRPFASPDQRKQTPAADGTSAPTVAFHSASPVDSAPARYPAGSPTQRRPKPKIGAKNVASCANV